MNLDLVVLVLLLMGAVTGYRSGAVRQISGWLGLGAAYLCARPLTALWGEKAAALMGWSQGAAEAGLSIIIWVVIYMGASQVSRAVLNRIEPGEEKGPLDQLLGAVAGSLKGGAVVLGLVSVLLALEKPLSSIGVDMKQRTEGSRVMEFAREHPLVGSPRQQAAQAASAAVKKGVEATERARVGAASALNAPVAR